MTTPGDLQASAWEQQYRAYNDAAHLPDRQEANRRRARVVRQTRALLARTQREHDAWVHAALHDPERKWFVAQVLAPNVPRRFVAAMIRAAMIRAAVYERNPGANRAFVEPCVRSAGHRRVNEALLEYVEHGTDFEKAGAVNALYWAGVGVQYATGRVIDERTGKPTPDAQAAYDAWAEVRARKRRVFLHLFVTTEDTAVRQSLIGTLSLDPAAYPVDLQHLVPRAIAIARQHPDPYIRQRVEIQLRTVDHPLLPPLPHRQPCPETPSAEGLGHATACHLSHSEEGR